MSVRSCLFIVLLSSSISLLIFSLVVLSIAKGGVLKSPTTTIVDFSISPFSSTNFSFAYFVALLFGECTLEVLCVLGGVSFYHDKCALLK